MTRGVDFDMSEFVRLEFVVAGRLAVDVEKKGNTHPACIFISGPSGCPGRDLTKYWAALAGGSSPTACATARSDDNAPNRRDDAAERISTAASKVVQTRDRSGNRG